jgi:ABC-type multidrug transport system fused ATPase/permease subunit
MSDDSSSEEKRPLTFADALQHYFAAGNELYEAKARGDTSEMTTVLQEFVDALRVSLLEAADKAGVGDTLKSALYDEQRLERLALWFRKNANNLKATKPGILSLEVLGSAGILVIVLYYVLRVDAWMAVLSGFLIMLLRLLSPWVVNRIAKHREKGLRTLRQIDRPSSN